MEGYQQALSDAMTMLSADERTIFIGQGVEVGGTFMSRTLQHLPDEVRLELPVAENMQTGMAIGMALQGVIPVSIYPRWNFLVAAADQLINHLDKMQPHVIIRVGVGSEEPLYPGDQHVGNFTQAFKMMMPNTYFAEVTSPDGVINEYKSALERKAASVIVEYADFY